MEEKREFDILLWGITGWTGVHLLEYFVEKYPLDKISEHEISWAVVARNEDKMEKTLKQVQDQYNVTWMDTIKRFKVDNTDEEAVDEVISQTKSVATVVGPYAQYGEPVIKSCIKNKAHYTDITGEAPWIRNMIDKYHNEAVENEVFILPFCGVDSIPSDISVFTSIAYLNDKIANTAETFDESTERQFTLRGYCTKMELNNRHKGGPTGGGGTVASAIGIAKESTKSNNRYNLLTGEDDESTADKDHYVSKGIGREKRLSKTSWTTFYPLAGGNEKVVRRSRYLLPQMYGNNLSFHEKKAVGSMFAATLTTVGLGFGMNLLGNSFTRKLVSGLLPKQSQTPNSKPKGDKYKPGSFEYVLFAEGEYKVGDEVEKVSCKTTFSTPDEVGWTYTGVMLAETCLALVKDNEAIQQECKKQGGFITTACLGNVLLERFAENTAILIKTEDLE